MTEKSTELTFSRIVNGLPEDVYYAFSTQQGWRDWMCDSARFEARPSGTYQLSWNSGWFTAGSIKEIERPKRILLTWRGKEDPDYTEVGLELMAEGDKTKVEIRHTGFGQGETWDQIREESEKGWEAGLENLVSIFDTGIDLRIARRPLLGIFLSDFNEKIAQEIGVPVTEGVRIDRPVEGLGAEKAGLQSSDVIVEMDEKPVTGFADVGLILDSRQAGDTIPVTFYRGPEKHTVDMTLSGREFEDYPLDPAIIAERMSASDKEVMEDLRQLLEGVTEEEADFSPSPEEWSVKETLVHLVDSEGFTLDYITELMADGQRQYAGVDGDPRPRMKALLETTPTIPELLLRLEKGKQEVVALLARAEKLKARKGVLWGLGLNFLQYPNVHEHNHMEQIKNAIATARGE